MSKRPKILVAEDEASLARVLRMRLEIEGFDVRTAADGAEAMRMIAEDRPDVLVCDLMMPVMDGFAVTGAIKGDPALRGIRILILTALKRENDVETLRKLGADAFASKPFDSAELTATIRRLVAG